MMQVLEDLIFFVLSKEQSSTRSQSAFQVTGHPHKERQKIMREQDILKLLFEILQVWL